jgi:tryptophan synthase alpha chain
MSAIDSVFDERRAADRTALIPFITAGDPDLSFTADVLRRLADAGASVCEVGVPYSDPIADGPIIQASYTRALEDGISIEGLLGTLGKVAPTLSTPLVTMVSYAIVLRNGAEHYVEAAKEAGVAGAIIPDLPVDEAGQFAAICRAADISLIQLVAPTTPRERALRIAETSSGFLYYVSVTGITGERSTFPAELVENVAWLRAQASLPVCVGFGISTAEHVRQLAPVADGLIVGSAIVRRIAQSESKPRDQVLEEVGEFVASLAAALNGTDG